MGKSINVTLSDALSEHVQRQVRADASIRDEADYIRLLVSRDVEAQAETAAWLHETLGAPFSANEGEYLAVSADDVVTRNRQA